MGMKKGLIDLHQKTQKPLTKISLFARMHAHTHTHTSFAVSLRFPICCLDPGRR